MIGITVTGGKRSRNNVTFRYKIPAKIAEYPGFTPLSKKLKLGWLDNQGTTYIKDCIIF